jgi:hypothetical protein
MSIKITFNGRDYNGADDMPALVRAQYMKAMQVVGDKNRNGIPDVIEQGGSPANSKIIFNGKEYKSADQMPSDVRKLYEDVLRKMPKDLVKNQLQVKTSFNVTHEIRDDSGAPISLETTGAMPFLWKLGMILVGLAIALGALLLTKKVLPGMFNF